jgi:hypothetical protein
MIEFEGERYYVNKPGVSQADLFQISSQIAAFAPAAGASSLATSFLTRIGILVPATAATSAALDLGAEALGSEQGVDATRAVVTGVTAGAAEAVAPLAARAWRAIRGTPALFDDATGQLTDKGRRAAVAAGLDPNKMGDDLARMFADEAADATGGTGAAARLRGKEFGIPMTRGQATGDFDRLAREEATRHGAFGQKAGAIVREFDDAQQQAMQAARGRVQSTIGGGETRIARPAQAGDIVTEGLQGRAATARGAVDAAYEAARGTDARISADGLRGLWRRMAESVSDYGLDPQLHPAATRALRNFRSIEAQTRRGARSGRITAVALKRLETERRKLGNLIDAAANKADRGALVRIKREFDGWIDDAVDNALFSGDAAALDLLKEARSARTRFGEMFEPRNARDEAGRIMQRIIGEERSPEEVTSYIFGKGRLGSRDVSARVLRRLKEVVGEGSEEWQALREAGWLKLSKEIGQDTFSPTKYRNNVNRALDEARSVLDELYTPAELDMFERFRDEVMRTVTPEAARNPSKTAYTLGRLARDWFGRIGTMLTFSGNPVGGAAAFTAKRAPEVMGTLAARRATSALPADRLRAPLFVSGATAAGRQATGEDPKNERKR